MPEGRRRLSPDHGWDFSRPRWQPPPPAAGCRSRRHPNPMMRSWCSRLQSPRSRHSACSHTTMGTAAMDEQEHGWPVDRTLPQCRRSGNLRNGSSEHGRIGSGHVNDSSPVDTGRIVTRKQPGAAVQQSKAYGAPDGPPRTAGPASHHRYWRSPPRAGIRPCRAPPVDRRRPAPSWSRTDLSDHAPPSLHVSRIQLGD